MAKRSQQTFLKRQREQKKAEKAAQKRARRDEQRENPTESVSEDMVDYYAPIDGEEGADQDATGDGGSGQKPVDEDNKNTSN